MDIKHLRYFVAVAEALSFAKAARTLHMSQPPLSKRIAEIEEQLGILLFERNSRHVSLTTAGESLLPHARSAVMEFDAAMRMARSLSPSRSREVRIALPPETSRAVMVDIASRLQNQNIEIQIAEANTAEQQALLAAGEVDIGVLRHPFDKNGLHVSPSLGQQLGVLMDVNHPLAQQAKIHLRDLAPYALVLFHRHYSPGLYDELLQLCKDGGYIPPRILHGVRMTATLIKSECAVALTTEWQLKRRGQEGTGEFLWIPIEGRPISWWTSVVCQANAWDSIFNVVMNEISASLQEHERWKPMPRPI